MSLEGDRISRGQRVQEIQGDQPAMDFCNRLNAAAAELGFPKAWSPARLSKVRGGTQDLSVEDATVLARLDPEQRGWTWIAFGVALKKGEDAWSALSKQAKKSKAG